MPGNASTMRVLRTLAFGASLDPFHSRNLFYQHMTSPILHTRATAASCSLPAVVFTHRSRALSPCLLPGRGTDPPRPPHTLSTFLLYPVHLAVPVHVRHYVRQYGPAGLVASRQDSAGYGPSLVFSTTNDDGEDVFEGVPYNAELGDNAAVIPAILSSRRVLMNNMVQHVIMSPRRAAPINADYSLAPTQNASAAPCQPGFEPCCSAHTENARAVAPGGRQVGRQAGRRPRKQRG